ncbi:MAG TPA: molybdopterin-binding protein, partial [Oscillospiraceae bacterium]|nr:molybdopterin-binding protein [Oscillospiraceae bacterium]
MTAEILCVGTELLLGDIVNTNAQFLARELAKLGISVHYQTVVGDNAQRLKSVLQIAFSRADMVVLTGGLGPTKDDLTKEIVAQYFGLELVFDQKAYDMLEKRILSYGLEKISESNRKQAYVPKGAIVLYNDNGTAPGCIIEKGGKTAILLPGPPNEMEAMFAKAREAYLNSISENTIFSVNIKIKS